MSDRGSSSSPPPQSSSSSTSSSTRQGAQSPPAERNRRASSPSQSARNRQYVPLVPSQLRNSHRPPPTPNAEQPPAPMADRNESAVDDEESSGYFRSGSRRRRSRSARTQSWDRSSCNNEQYGDCDHGVLSPRIRSPDAENRADTLNNDNHSRDDRIPPETSDDDVAHRLLGSAVADGVFGSATKQSTTERTAKENGVSHTRTMYLGYYLPVLRWTRQLSWSFLAGDFIAALTMASFYIPMSLSFASNLGHVPPINGLYSFVINPLVYALLGTCPQMVVGPEAAGSLLTGNVVRESISKGKLGDNEGALHAQVAGVVTGVAGAILFVAGVARLGFLDNILSRPFLRGFISAIGVVIFIDQLVPEMGLMALLNEHKDYEHGSPAMKLYFLVENITKAHGLTTAVSFGSFALTMVCREIKKRLQPRYPRVAYVPDRFVIVVLATVLAWKLDWASKGVAILGNVTTDDGRIFKARFPFNVSHMKHLESALSTSFIISLLGFFESTVAAKGLRTASEDGIKDVTLSANRELIALGTANIIGGTFMALPAFGGYGRSKVNASTGGRTPMSSVFLSLITLFCITFLLPAFYYIPKGVLSALISVVAWSLIEEAPHDLIFFYKTRSWTELFLAALVFFATVFYSLPLGIAFGLGFSLLRLVKHATRPRIQLLGRVQGTDQFENIEADPERIEKISSSVVVRIPEPLHWANTGDLRERLRRLMDYGETRVHPSMPRVRNTEQSRSLVFDIHGVTSLDGAGAQVLLEILQDFLQAGPGRRVIFARCPNPRSETWRMLDRSGIIELCGGPRHFVSGLDQALRLSEIESLTEWYRDHPQDSA